MVFKQLVKKKTYQMLLHSSSDYLLNPKLTPKNINHGHFLCHNPKADSDQRELFDPTRLIIWSAQVVNQIKQKRTDKDAEEIGDGVFSRGSGRAEEPELVGELLGSAG